MIEGVFVESPSDQHVALRSAVLERADWYPAPAGADPGPLDSFPERLAEHGVAVADLPKVLDNQELIALARRFGVPQLQLDERLAPWIEDDVILRLRADLEKSDDLTWELLFSRRYVMMHTELAGRPVALQPRYLLFQCVDAPRPGEGGQTLLVSMIDVVAGLTNRQVEILLFTRNVEFESPPAMLRIDESSPVLSFKDAQGQPIPWRYDGPDPSVTVGEADQAVRRLHEVVYDAAVVRGMHWVPKRLGVFDNWRFLHARSALRQQAGSPKRFLREVRIQQSPSAAP